MFEAANEFLGRHRDAADQLIRRYIDLDKPLLLRAELVDHVEDFCNTEVGRVLTGSILYVQQLGTAMKRRSNNDRS